MYKRKRIIKPKPVDSDGIAALKIDLLRMTFCYRAEDNLDDSQIIQKIIDKGYLTTEEILSERDNIRVSSDTISPFYSNIISAVAKKAINDTTVQDILIDYFCRIYFPEYSQKKKYNAIVNPTVFKKFKKGVYKEGHGCWVAFMILLMGDEDIELAVFVQKQCNELSLINPLSDVKQPSLLDYISDLLEYDMEEHQSFTSRFLEKRFSELFRYICKKANVNPGEYSKDEAIVATCAAATGVSGIDIFDYEYPSLAKKGLFKPSGIGLAKDFACSYIGPLNRVGNTVETRIAAKLLKADYGQAFYFKNLVSFTIAATNCGGFIKNAILEYLLDTLSEAYFNPDKDNLRREQIMRKLEYTETDCRIVLEKVSAAIQFFVITNHLANMINSSIEYGNYADIRQSSQKAQFSSRSSLNEQTQKNIDKRIQQSVSSMSADLDYEKEKRLQLEEENRKLKEQILQLDKQINRKESANKRITDLKEQLDILNEENNTLNLRLNKKLEKEIAGSEATSKEIESAILIEDNFFADKRVIVLGGRWEINRKLAELMPKSKFVESKTDTLLNVRNYEAAVIFIDHISHALYFKYIKPIKNNNLPVLFLRGTSMENLKKEMFLFFEDTIL